MPAPSPQWRTEISALVIERSMAAVEETARSLDIDALIERERGAGVEFGPFHRKWLTDRAPNGPAACSSWPRRRASGRRRPLERPPGVCLGRLRRLPARQPARGDQHHDDGDQPVGSGALGLSAGRRDPRRQDLAGRVRRRHRHDRHADDRVHAKARDEQLRAATGTTLGISPTVTMEGVTAQPFYGEFQFGCRSIGVAAGGATFTGNGFVILPAAAASSGSEHCVMGGAIPATIDHTIAQGIASPLPGAPRARATRSRRNGCSSAP
jgi:hypothetical protein